MACVLVPSTPEMAAVVEAINEAEGRVFYTLTVQLPDGWELMMRARKREIALYHAAPLVLTPAWTARGDDWTAFDRYRKD